jgi:DNA repair exonuclease SbcCD ATPase subunit
LKAQAALLMQEVSNADHEIIEEHLRLLDRKLSDLKKKIDRRLHVAESTHNIFADLLNQTKELHDWFTNCKEQVNLSSKTVSWKLQQTQNLLAEREVCTSAS